jgi:LmbE family N-acetylglucosaminyl deacetylase/glycosyltransferase involved in cell wall biosynthesis
MMRSEEDLIPYAPGRLDGSPVLVLAPHPDDEIFGCGGVLVQALNAGADVRVVFLTDGDAQGEAETRRREGRAAAVLLGLREPVFWGLADRSLRPDDAELADRLRSLLIEIGPHVLLLPSPAEIHPDHRALAILVYRLLQTAAPGDDLHTAMQATRVAGYEISAALRPNLLVDVTAEWEAVVAAAGAYESQIERLPYVEVMEGMAQARSLTLPSEVRRAEAYYVADLRFIRTHSAAEWAAAQGPSVGLESAAEMAALDVVVRTRNRPQLLREALGSIRAQLHPPGKVIVINDGGESVAEVCRTAAEGLDLDLIEAEESRGRAAAAQQGLERAEASHVVYLDDDDLMFPDHLLVLGRAVASGTAAPYVDAVQGLWEHSDDGTLTPVARHRTFGGEFDAALFELVNHIPLPCVAIPRGLALEVGGFDPEMDLYEDWDLLLRLVRRTPMTYLPCVTCEYRVIAGAGGITGANQPGSEGQLAALQKIWSRHGLLSDGRRLASAVMALVAGRDRANEQARLRDETLVEVQGTKDGLEAEVSRLRAEAEGSEATHQELVAEIERLNGILRQIYSSWTWKLHQLVERLRKPFRPK